MALYRPPDQYSRALDALRQRAVGVFDTGLRCICGNHNIMDHAAEAASRSVHGSTRDMVCGPGPDHAERFSSFRVHHSYYCSGCGLTYRVAVIEGVREYKPLDIEAEGERLLKAEMDNALKGLRTI